MSEYIKIIEGTDTGMVTAKVYFGDRRCGLKFITSMFDTQKSLKKKLRKANEWADERIKILKEGENAAEVGE